MSHYSYKRKLWLETSKGDLLPLALYADSSVRNSEGGYVWNWCIYNLGFSGILINKEKFKEKAEEVYRDEIDRLIDYELKYNGEVRSNIGPESDSYYGTKYPGGGKLKNMRSFHSVKKTIPLGTWLQNGHRFTIIISVYDKDTYRTVDSKEIWITCEQDVYDAQAIYDEMKVRWPQCGMCLGVAGMY